MGEEFTIAPRGPTQLRRLGFVEPPNLIEVLLGDGRERCHDGHVVQWICYFIRRSDSTACQFSAVEEELALIYKGLRH